MDEDAANLGAVGAAIEMAEILRRCLKIVPICGTRKTCPVLKDLRRTIKDLDAFIEHWRLTSRPAKSDPPEEHSRAA